MGQWAGMGWVLRSGRVCVAPTYPQPTPTVSRPLSTPPVHADQTSIQPAWNLRRLERWGGAANFDALLPDWRWIRPLHHPGRQNRRGGGGQAPFLHGFACALGPLSGGWEQGWVVGGARGHGRPGARLGSGSVGGPGTGGGQSQGAKMAPRCMPPRPLCAPSFCVLPGVRVAVSRV